MIEDALRLWTTVAPYSGFRCETISWRLLPAIANDQLRLFYRDDECVGLITWAFMTNDEFETRVYDGAEIFGRDDGDKMVFVDMIAPHGKNDVLWMCKEMRKQFYCSVSHGRERIRASRQTDWGIPKQRKMA